MVRRALEAKGLSLTTTGNWIQPTTGELERGPQALDEIAAPANTLSKVRPWAKDLVNPWSETLR